MNTYMIKWRVKGKPGAYSELYYANTAQAAVDEFREDFKDNFCAWYISAVYKETPRAWEYCTDWD